MLHFDSKLTELTPNGIINNKIANNREAGKVKAVTDTRRNALNLCPLNNKVNQARMKGLLLLSADTLPDELEGMVLKGDLVL